MSSLSSPVDAPKGRGRARGRPTNGIPKAEDKPLGGDTTSLQDNVVCKQCFSFFNL